MKYVYGISFTLLLAVVICPASAVPAKKEKDIVDGSIQREQRQIKSSNGVDPDVKMFNGQGAATPTLQTTQGGGLPNSSTQQMPFNNLQIARYPQYGGGFMMSGYGSGLSGIPNVGYPLTGTLPPVPNQAYPGVNLPGAPLNYPANVNMNFYPGYPEYMFGGAQVYPASGLGQVPNNNLNNLVDLQNAQNFGNLGNLGSLGNFGSFVNPGTLDNLVNMVNMQGMQTPLGGGSAAQLQQLTPQQSQLQPQIAGYPLMQGFYPQMGYSPAFQNYQG